MGTTEGWAARRAKYGPTGHANKYPVLADGTRKRIAPQRRVAKILAALDSGLSQAAVARKLKVSRQAVNQAVARWRNGAAL